jgi:ADP-ribosylglycohydrolase
MRPLLLALALGCAPAPAQDPPRLLEIPADVLEDKIRGGMLAQIFGNLNGLPHEMKYIHEPGQVDQYTPGLPQGARTDDDTDLEWVYVCEMARTGEVFLPPARIRELWKAHINRSIWCANLYARRLMDLGLEPPLTGRIAINPWADFNISGQFLCESFGLMAPGLPRTASRIGLHYTRVAIDGEPAQTTQLFCSMIAAAFFETDLQKILDAGLAAVDPASETAAVAADVRRWHREHPDDWRATRLKTKEKYQRHKGEMRDKNGYELNTAGTVAALLYGRGDFVGTLKVAFNFGWDADNNAATSGAIIGVLKGRKWMDAQGWTVKDVYANTTRDGMPADETISGFSAKVAAIARKVILAHGGEEAVRDGRPVLRIRPETPANVEPLPKPLDRMADLRRELVPAIERDLAGPDRARAAYLALCLDESDRLKKDRPAEWAAAVDALGKHTELVREIFNAPRPSGARIQARASAEGLKKPPK